MNARLSDRGRALILEFEVGGGKSYYDKFLARPTWPGVASGVTIGIGYDLGYNARVVIEHDWQALPAATIQRLAAVAGIKGARAKPFISKLRDIAIPWPIALEVFERTTVPRFWRLATLAYPGFEQLQPDAQAVLLSLTFNRGTAMSGERRRELRAIRTLVPHRDYAGIADELRAMKRLWPNVRGLRLRRDAEAVLMARCS